ncbi:MAG TPA: hypothetical protein VJL07_00745 [Dehalococcoidia bacterium]|nr:hypothetical protein [Dehalococcoidia bacterium]
MAGATIRSGGSVMTEWLGPRANAQLAAKLVYRLIGPALRE